PKLDWAQYRPPRPEFTGIRTFDDYPLDALRDYIDWTPFFLTWELSGKFPAILDDPLIGEAARNLYADAQAMLDRLIHGQLRSARAVIGFWPAAQTAGGDTRLFADESRRETLATVHCLRQQQIKQPGQALASLADYIAPENSAVADWLGGFAVTAGLGADELVAAYEAAGDDYNAILVKALADR